MSFFVICDCNDCMWYKKNEQGTGLCRKAHITVSKAICLDYAKEGLEHTVKNLSKITDEFRNLPKIR